MNQAAARTLWREFVNERSSTIPDDTTVDYYLQRGLEALNEIVGFAYADDTSISTADGTQEYALPSTVVRVEWVEYGTTMLERLDQEEFRQTGVAFRTTTKSTPTKYYLYGRKIGFYPKPDAVTSITIRHVKSPADFTSVGFDSQLSDQDQPVPILYAAAMWCGLHPSEVNKMRAEWLMAEFGRRAEAIKGYYAERRLAR